MSSGGTASYEGVTEIPDIVGEALDLARRLGFALSCRPEQGRLLRLLAAGRPGGTVGETGTGCGVGLAWLLSGAGPSTAIYSVESDEERVTACRRLFAAHHNVSIERADWHQLFEHGPFDLLFLDGGGSGKSEAPLEVEEALVLGGTVVIDDFTPMGEWPPTYLGVADHARLHWLEHRSLKATEIRLAPDLAALVATRVR